MQTHSHWQRSLENDPLRMQAEEKLANFIRSHPDFPDDLSRKLVDQRRVELALKIGGMAKKFGSGHAEILQLRRELDLLEQVPEIGAKQLAVESEKVILASHLPENNRLQIRKVANSDPNAELMNMEVTTDGNEVLEQEIGVGRDVIVADQHVESVSIVSEADEHRLDITLNRIGGARLAKATARDLGKMRLGILVNGRIISAPVVQNQLGKRFVISGLKSREEALDLLRSFPSWDAQIKSWEAVTWLREIDEGKYRESYESSSSVLQEKFSQEIWVVMLTNLREPLGIVGSRGLKKYSEVKSVDGNEYRLILFDTHFSNQQDAVETVTFVKERDGAWKAAGYFIR